MGIRIYFIFFQCILVANTMWAQLRTHPFLEWRAGAELRQEDGTFSKGFAGAVAGLTGDRLILAGGAHFPEKMPWEGGVKKYFDEIYVLKKSGGQYGWEKNISVRLPEPIAYCGSTSTDSGIVYAGGENASGLSDRVFLLYWDPQAGKPVTRALPDLPCKLSNIGLTHIGNIIYAVGGDEPDSSSSQFCCLDLDDKHPQWKQMQPLPLALANALVVAQSGKEGQSIFVIGGRTRHSSGISDLHSTVFAYNIRHATWKQAASINDGKDTMNLSAAPGIAIDKHYILVAGGDNGVIFHEIEKYMAAIRLATSSQQKLILAGQKNELNIHHPGFYRGILLYNTLLDGWQKLGELPFPAQVTTTAVCWGHTMVLPSGEIKPGLRSPYLMTGKFKL